MAMRRVFLISITGSVSISATWGFSCVDLHFTLAGGLYFVLTVVVDFFISALLFVEIFYI